MHPMLIARGRKDVHLEPRYGNRHGLIAGATGTGKSVSLMVLAERFSRLGVPVFLADVKGDLAGLSQPASVGDKLARRLAALGITDFQPDANPVVFWDLFGRDGHPMRATVSEIGPIVLARMLELNETQEGVLNVLFRVADEEGLLLLDLKDLRAMLGFLSDNAREISSKYGLVSTPSIAAIQRALLTLENQGAAGFLGEPALALADLFQVDPRGRGVINLLAADQLILRPKLYSSFLLWLLSELFEQLPEVGDLDRPRLVFFFDEAHLLFDGAPPALVKRIEQVVRLIRSKGVGVYFCTQHPDDVPAMVLGQLGNRIQHALRAFTPRDQKSVRTAAETFPPNPGLDVARAITELAVGEALVSTLGEGGIPSPVERAMMLPPVSRIGTIDEAERAAVRAASPVGDAYDETFDRDSAFEQLQARTRAASPPQPPPLPEPSSGSWGSVWTGPAPTRPTRPARPARSAPAPAPTGQMPPFGRPKPAPGPARSSTREGIGEAFAKSVARSVGSTMGRQILRGVLGAILKK